MTGFYQVKIIYCFFHYVIDISLIFQFSIEFTQIQISTQNSEYEKFLLEINLIN